MGRVGNLEGRGGSLLLRRGLNVFENDRMRNEDAGTGDVVLSESQGMIIQPHQRNLCCDRRRAVWAAC